MWFANCRLLRSRWGGWRIVALLVENACFRNWYVGSNQPGRCGKGIMLTILMNNINETDGMIQSYWLVWKGLEIQFFPTWSRHLVHVSFIHKLVGYSSTLSLLWYYAIFHESFAIHKNAVTSTKQQFEVNNILYKCMSIN